MTNHPNRGNAGPRNPRTNRKAVVESRLPEAGFVYSGDHRSRIGFSPAHTMTRTPSVENEPEPEAHEFRPRSAGPPRRNGYAGRKGFLSRWTMIFRSDKFLLRSIREHDTN